jgi:hypothetical protein
MSRPGDWGPLSAADPVPGDVEAVRQLARRWADTAQAVETATHGLRQVHDSTTHWRSASGRTFAERAGVLAGALDRAWWRYAAGAEILHGYARALDGAQGRADTALRRGRRAADDLDAAERMRRAAVTARALASAATGSPAPAEHTERRAEAHAAEARRRLADAERELQGAEDDWREAAVTACAELDSLADDGLTDRLDGAFDLVETATRWTSRTSAVLGLGSVALVPVLPLAAPLAAGAALATGGVALAGTAVLYAGDRATGRDVGWAALGPTAGTAAKVLRRLDALVPDELPRPGSGAPAVPAVTPAAVRPGRSVRVAEGVGTGSDINTVTGDLHRTATADKRTGRGRQNR